MRGRDDKSIQRFALFQASTAKKMRSVLFWDITQRKLVIAYWRCGTTYRSHLQWSRSLLLTLGPTGCSETTVRNYHPTLRNVPEEQRSYTEIYWENLKVRNHLKKLEADGSLILMVLTTKKWGMGWENVQLIRVDHDREHWRTLVETVTNFQVPHREGNFLSYCGSTNFSDTLCPTGVV